MQPIQDISLPGPESPTTESDQPISLPAAIGAEGAGPVEWIFENPSQEPLAAIIRAEYEPARSEFVTPPRFIQQVGFIAYPTDGEVVPHEHLPLERNVRGTTEVVLVWRGRCWVDFYGQDRSLSSSRQLRAGDVVILVAGGHGFRMLEQTVFLEIKQGPYIGPCEKQRFLPPNRT